MTQRKPPGTRTRVAGDTLDAIIRTARKRHRCDECGGDIEPGTRYEYRSTPPGRCEAWESERWLTWRSHYPRNPDGGWFLWGCTLAAAYGEHRRRALVAAGLLKERDL